MTRAVRVAGSVALFVALLSAGLQAGPQKAPTAKQQVEFGVKMASRGLWSEALFRFRQAEKLDPDNAGIHNNLAVAHEALGLFEEALASYRRALELQPQNKGVRRNYSRFVEFYQSFKPPDAGEEAEEEPDGEEEPGAAGDAARVR